MITILATVLLLSRNTITIATIVKDKYLLGLTYNAFSLVSYHHGGEHGSIQADMGLK